MAAIGLYIALATAARVPLRPPAYIFSNPSDIPSTLRIPTVHDSAILARRVLNLSTIGTLSTVFPSPQHLSALSADEAPLFQHAADFLPSSVSLSGDPIGLMDYYAACDPESYAPTILAISIATSFRNARAGSNVSLSLRWHPPQNAPPSDDPYTYSAANMPRFSLMGWVEAIKDDEIKDSEVEECFFTRHQDARAWRPGNAIHESWWGRLRVEAIYWIGGFGDRAYIGYIPREEWEGVTRAEIAKARLVGEDGYTAPLLDNDDVSTIDITIPGEL